MNIEKSKINDWYASDYITSEQSDKYIEKLNKKKATAGQTDTLTKSERVCKILDNTIDNLTLEIRDIKIKEEKELKNRNVGKSHNHRVVHTKNS